MNARGQVSEVTAARIVALSEEGLSTRQIALRVGVHFSSVSRCMKRFRETGSYSRRPTSGRPRTTDPTDDRFIRLHALRQRNLTAPDIQNLIRNVRNLRISTNTVRRRLVGAGLRVRRLAKGPQLTTRHRMQRLRFARDHQHWTVEEWKAVLFTDETRVALHIPDGRDRVWRRRGERYSRCCTVGVTPFRGGSIMFWGGISFEARTELVPVRRGAITAQRYVEEILEEHVMPYMPFIGPQALLVHDNARPHVARCVTDYLNYTGIRTIAWPARSPDLNCIEHLWDTLKRTVRHRQHAPSSLEELETAVLEEWDQISQETIQQLFNSMPRRMEAVIRARGGLTRY